MDTCTKTQYNFQRIKWEVLPKKHHTEWFLVIEDEDTLHEYMLHRFKMLVGEYKKLRKKPYEFHCTSKDEIAVEMTFLTCDNLRSDRRTIIDDYAYMEEKLMSGYLKIFKDHGIIFITENNAIRPIHNHKKNVVNSVERDSFEWPKTDYTEENINIIRWPRGKHYYAKIGAIEVVDDDGNIKWPTAESAEEQAKLFLKKMEKDDGR